MATSGAENTISDAERKAASLLEDYRKKHTYEPYAPPIKEEKDLPKQKHPEDEPVAEVGIFKRHRQSAMELATGQRKKR